MKEPTSYPAMGYRVDPNEGAVVTVDRYVVTRYGVLPGSSSLTVTARGPDGRQSQCRPEWLYDSAQEAVAAALEELKYQQESELDELWGLQAALLVSQARQHLLFQKVLSMAIDI